MKDFRTNKFKNMRLYLRCRGMAMGKKSVGQPRTTNTIDMANFTEANRRGLLETKIGRIAASLLDVNPDDLLAHQFISELLAEDNVRVARTAPFMKKPVIEGDGHVVIGEDPFEQNPHYEEFESITHTLIAGISGCGKSTLLQALATQYAVHNSHPKILLIDAEKNELRGLVPIFQRYGQDLKVFKGTEFPFNLLAPPKNVCPYQYIEHICQTIGSALKILEPGVRLLKEVIFQQYLENGILDGLQDRTIPVLHETREKIIRHKGANPLTKEGLLSRVDSVLPNTKGLRFRRGIDTEYLQSNNILLECGDMSPEGRDLLAEGIVTKGLLYREALGYVNTSPDWILFLDDSQRICSSNHDSHLAHLINIVRSSGIRLCFSLQSPCNIAPAILSNTGTKYFGILGSAEDIYAMANIFLLSQEQKLWLAAKQQRGQFLTQLGNGNGWRSPFLIEVRPGMVHDYLSPATPVAPEFHITDERYDSTSTNHSDYGTDLIEATEYRNWVPPEWKITRITEPNQAKSESLSMKELEFLSAVHKSPGQPCSSYNKNLSFGQKGAIAIRKELIEKSLLCEELVRTKVYGRTAKLLTLSKSGEAILKQFQEKQNNAH